MLRDYAAMETAMAALNSSCPHGIRWIERVFGECVDNEAKLAGFVIGFVSLLLWLVPLFPQLQENYRNKRCDGLSVYFLIFWFVGDTANMIGAILTRQLPMQIVIGVYYIVQDTALLSQYMYYTRFYRPKYGAVPTESPPPESAAVLSSLLVGSMAFSWCVGSGLSGAGKADPYAIHSIQPGGRRLLQQFFVDAYDEVGYFIGAFSALSYFCGRIPQLYQNYQRKSVEGLSKATFVIIVFANLTYGLSVILAGQGWSYILHHLPWLAGSLGCCFLDMLVLAQFFIYYRGGAYDDEEDDAPLIRPGV